MLTLGVTKLTVNLCDIVRNDAISTHTNTTHNTTARHLVSKTHFTPHTTLSVPTLRLNTRLTPYSTEISRQIQKFSIRSARITHHHSQ